MIFTVKNTHGMKNVKVFDPLGNLIKAVTYYDTCSREVEFYATTRTNPNRFIAPHGRMIKIRCHMDGSWIEVDGVKY